MRLANNGINHREHDYVEDIDRLGKTFIVFLRRFLFKFYIFKEDKNEEFRSSTQVWMQSPSKACENLCAE